MRGEDLGQRAVVAFVRRRRPGPVHRDVRDAHFGIATYSVGERLGRLQAARELAAGRDEPRQRRGVTTALCADVVETLHLLADQTRAGLDVERSLDLEVAGSDPGVA